MPAPLPTLREKLARRKKARARQAKLWRRTKKAGHGKAAKDHTRAIKKLKRLIKKAINAKPKSGEGPWGGCKSIIDREVVPVAKRKGVPITSRKRSASHPLSISNPSSDHNAANTNAYAVDFGTYSGSELAHAIARKLGIQGYANGSYTGHYITRSGKQFRVQILWAVPGHFDHVHVGIRSSE
jgi:hypothetical protein